MNSLIKSATAITVLLFVLCLSIYAQSLRLTKDTFPVPSGSYYFVPFKVMNDGTVAGRFTAEGGSGNDIRVLVLDEDAFVNWKNGHSVNTLYNSGQVTVGRLNLRLPSGNYYLIFSNTFSTFTNKVVTSDIALFENNSAETFRPVEPVRQSESYRSNDERFRPPTLRKAEVLSDAEEDSEQAQVNFDKAHRPISITGLMTASAVRQSGSKTYTETGQVVKVFYDETEINGFRLALPDGTRKDLRFDANFSNAERGWIKYIIAPNKRVKVVFVVMGNGGFWEPVEVHTVPSPRRR